jgi:hypothetical protein
MVKENRDISIDGLRGFAILCMFYAHLIPHFSERGEALFVWERVISSIAAPLFLFLVGYNFNKTQKFRRVFKRSLVILFVACSLDVVVWHIFPFYSFDVLYLIGISLIFMYLIRNFSKLKLLLLLFIIIIISISIQFLGYYSITLDEPYFNESYHLSQIVYNFFINGWFPFFPWIVFPLLGFLSKSISLEFSFLKVISAILFSLLLLSIFFVDFNWRPFAVEIFYPASWFYLLFAFAYLFFIWIYRGFFSNRYLYFLINLGKSSLFLYIFHLTVYSFIADHLILYLNNRFLWFFLFLCSFWLIAFLLNRYKNKWQIFQKSEVLQILLGK